jgi:Chitobiase/beta-hexosaminidase C-terminal domain/Legume lectin domain
MRNHVFKYRSSCFSLRSVFRLFLLGLPLLNCRHTFVCETRRIRSLVILRIVVMTLGLFGLCAAHAQLINYASGFAGSSGQIWLNGAVLSGSALQLTNDSTSASANNAWFMTPVNVQAFTTTFSFAETCPTDCGDGLGFMIISVSNPSSAGYNYSGFSGGQFSWSQCTGTGNTVCPAINSILVKFDLYNAQTSQTGANLTGFYTDGEYPQLPNPQYDMSASGINMESGDLMRATLAYNGTVLTETLTDTVTGATYTKGYTTNIPALVGGDTAYVGFGGSMGSATVTQNLESWTYTVESPGQAAVPTFSPAAGTYSGSQSVTLSSASSGAVICYNTTGSPATNGSTSCAAGTLYTGPVTVSSSETLYAVAGGTGFSDSPASSASYVLQNSVATPSFSPAAGTYTSAQSVTISDVTSNATIYYTTNGTVPTASSTKYTGPIAVSSTETLEAIAAATGETNSSVASAAYTINSPTSVATPTFSPAAGTYTYAPSVTISDATSGATIYYTTDGTVPTVSSTKYIGAITVSSTETVEAIAVATGNIESAVASVAYTISLEPSVATPTFSPSGGAYTSTQSVTISDATSDATIYYTTNGTAPTTSSTEYSGPITVSSTETLKAIAAATGDNNSAVGFAAYNITPPTTVSTPTFSPPAGAYTSAQSVTISDATSGAAIYYTTNGTAPTTSSIEYSGPITVNSTETLEAIAVAAGATNSAVASAAYTITSALPVVSTPTFSPVAGTYTSAQSVIISDATSGATIYYTTNGTTPTTSSTKYSGPITVSSTEMLQAIAASTGDTNSAVASAAYTISALPNFTLGASAATLTVDYGGQGTVMLTVTPQNGFDSSVSFACSGLPAGATCSFSPSAVTPSGAAATTQLTISASAQSSALQPRSRPFSTLAELALTVCIFAWRKRRGSHHWLLLAVAFAGMGLVSGCGGSGGMSSTSTSTPPPPTPASTTSTVTVTATAGTLQGTATITLTVN